MTHEEAMDVACGVMYQGMHDDTLGPALEAAMKAYLEASGMVIVPCKATDEMKFHTLVAGYLAVGSTGDEALSLAKDKMNSEGYGEFSDAQYSALLASVPDPFKSK